MKVEPGLTLLGLNLIGVAAYFALAMRGWRNTSDGVDVPVTGEPFIWVLCLPVLGVFIVVNVIWGALLFVRNQNERWSFLATTLIWTAAVVFDFSYH